MKSFSRSILQVFFLVFVVQNVFAHEIELEAIVVDDVTPGEISDALTDLAKTD